MAASRILNQATNPYSAGALVLDTTPITQYYLNQQAKKEAKDEALDKYYQDQMASLSSKGLREIDMSRFSDKFNKLKQLFIQNKEAIKNPMKYGFEKSQEFNELKQELTNYPELSKQAKDEKAQALKISMNPANRDLIDIPSFDESLKFHDLPIGDPSRKALNLSNLPYMVKPMTPQEKQNYIKGNLSLMGKTGSFGKGTTIDKYTTETPYTEEYSASALKMAADKTKLDVTSNKTLARTAELDFEKTPIESQVELNKLHQEYYGKPIQNGADILAAEVIQAGKLASTVTPKRTSDFEAKNQLAFNQSMAKIAANAAKNAPQQLQGNSFDTIGESEPLSANGKTIRNGIATNDADGTPYSGEIFIRKQSLPATIYAALKSGGFDSDILSENQGFNAKIKDGRIVGLTDKEIGYIDRQTMENAQLKYNTEPSKGTQLGFGLKNTQSPSANKQKGKKSAGIVWKKK